MESVPEDTMSNTSSMDNVFALLNGHYPEIEDDLSEQSESLEKQRIPMQNYEASSSSTASDRTARNSSDEAQSRNPPRKSSATQLPSGIRPPQVVRRSPSLTYGVTSVASFPSRLQAPQITIDCSKRCDAVSAPSRKANSVIAFGSKIPPLTTSHRKVRQGSNDDTSSVASSAISCATYMSCYYNTPLQRRNEDVRLLKNNLHAVTMQLQSLDHQYENKVRAWDEELEELLLDCDVEVSAWTRKMSEAQELLSAARLRQMTMAAKISTMGQIVEQKGVEFDEDVERDQSRYMDMFSKGHAASQFEFECEEFLQLAEQIPSAIDVNELEKLVKRTEDEAEHWKVAQLHDFYIRDREAASLQTTKEANLRSLRDAIFHFLTQSGRENVDLLRTVCINLCEFSPVQMKAIEKAFEGNKRSS